MNLELAKRITGGLSNPSKMPCESYSLPAQKCKTGSKLVKIKNSVCSGCYALKGFYRMGNVKKVLNKRLKAIKHSKWTEAIIFLIKATNSSGYMRWHDAGDIQSLEHFKKIVAVAISLPHIQFWLPTKEYKIVQDYFDTFGPFPANLNVRLSGYMIDGPTPDGLAKRIGATVSSVSSQGEFTCPSSAQSNKCLTCRRCWDGSVFSVIYKKH